jgi:MFS transporter, PAT family, beta-lactamase induction signal transducer AmpG
MSLAEQRRLRLFTLCVLYVAQGIPWGFMATTLPAYLTQRGLDFGFITAALSFTYLPYSFKWVWGPIIDAFTLPRFGRRRPWILFAQAMMALTVVAMVTFDVTTELKLLAWMIFLHTVFNALQDVAVDALAVDLLDDDERGRANGLMYGCKYGGGLIGGYVMASVIYYASLDAALIVQAGILVAIMMVPLFVRERDRGAPVARQPMREVVSALGVAFSLRSSLVAVLVMLGMNFANGVLSATGYRLYVGTLGWTYKEYTALTGGWALAVGGAAAATTGFLVDRLGRKTVAATASILMALGWVVFGLLRDHWDHRELVWASGLYGQAMLGTMSVALIAMCMDLSWDKIGGSQFTAYMALSNFSVVLGQQFAVKANAWWEFHGVHWVAAAIQVMVTSLLVFVDPGELRRKLPLPAGTRPNPLGIGAVCVLVAFLVVMTVRASMKYL